MTTETEKSLPIVPLTKVPEATGYEWLTVPTLRQWVFYSKPRYAASGQLIPGNGFDACLLRVGKRILVNLTKLQDWLNSHQQKSNSN